MAAPTVPSWGQPVGLWGGAGGVRQRPVPPGLSPRRRPATRLTARSFPRRPRGKEACLNCGCFSRTTTHPHPQNVSRANPSQLRLLPHVRRVAAPGALTPGGRGLEPGARGGRSRVPAVIHREAPGPESLSGIRRHHCLPSRGMGVTRTTVRNPTSRRVSFPDPLSPRPFVNTPHPTCWLRAAWMDKSPEKAMGRKGRGCL